MRTLTPPKEFQSWLDYAIATMDARGAYLDRIFTGEIVPSPDDIRSAAQAELDRLQQKSAMPWIGILETWKTKLSTRLGRSAEDILSGNLLATDFSDDGVHIHFADGTDLTFRRAFYLGETPADGAIHRVAVFTEHGGYHEFWIGLDDRVAVIDHRMQTETGENFNWTNEIRQAQAEVAQGLVVPYKFGSTSTEDVSWDSMAPVGGEFGSPDYDQLMAEDAAKFASDLNRWVQQCRAEADVFFLEKDEISDAHNVQLALRELGLEVTVDVAASVWKHYSKSMMAGWMSGAETVQSAARILYLNCPRPSRKN